MMQVEKQLLEREAKRRRLVTRMTAPAPASAGTAPAAVLSPVLPAPPPDPMVVSELGAARCF